MSEQVHEIRAGENPLTRMLGVLTAPGSTFQHLAERPVWLAPLVTYFVVLSIAFGVYSMRADWEAIITNQVESSALIRFAPEEQQDVIVKQATKAVHDLSPWEFTLSKLVQQILPTQVVFFHLMALVYATLFVMMGAFPELKLGRMWLNFLLCLLLAVGYVLVSLVGGIAFRSSPQSALVLGIPSVLALVGGWLWLLGRFVRQDESFRKVLSVCTHSGMVFAVGAVAFLAVSLATPQPIETPPNEIVKSSVGALITTENSAVKSLLGSLDVFSLWVLAVLTIGFRTVTKVSSGIAASLTILPWAAIVMVKIASSAAFG
ncbi:MAG: YIP1 family protein [Acidobacteriota bacterium]